MVVSDKDLASKITDTIVIQLGGGAFKQIIDQTQLDQIKATVSMDTTTTFAKKTEIKEPIRQEWISYDKNTFYIENL